MYSWYQQCSDHYPSYIQQYQYQSTHPDCVYSCITAATFWLPVEWPGSAHGRQTRTAPLASWLYAPVIWENENKIQCTIHTYIHTHTHTYIHTCNTIKVSKRKTSEWLSKTVDTSQYELKHLRWDNARNCYCSIELQYWNRIYIWVLRHVWGNTSQRVDELWTRLKITVYSTIL